ncbi:MAG: hypothetical protein QOK38_697, partial [Acidobacteriaceae bacterium]|nr:hypothetical protein [Acidobacteriaceae bacterium]
MLTREWSAKMRVMEPNTSDEIVVATRGTF